MQLLGRLPSFLWKSGIETLESLPRRNGEGGIRSTPQTQLVYGLRFMPQPQMRQRLELFWSFVVVAGCLGLFGIVFSTLSAHLARLKSQDNAHAALTAPAILNSRSRSQRRQKNSGTGSTGSGQVCASYARYSSENQREESITDQQRKCKEAAAGNGHEISSHLEYFDKEVSGTTLHRDGLDKLVAAAEAGAFSVLYFHNLSRLARESVITMPLLKRLVYVDGVRVISVTEGIDSDRDGWELMASILSVMHERYIKDLSDNVFRGQEGTVLAGLCVGDCCFGYRSEPIPGSDLERRDRHAKPRMRYCIDDETASWVKRIFHWFVVDQRSIRWITRELNRLSAPKDHRATTKNWRHQMVAELLKRKKYVGNWTWWGRKTTMQSAHRPSFPGRPPGGRL